MKRIVPLREKLNNANRLKKKRFITGGRKHDYPAEEKKKAPVLRKVCAGENAERV